MCPLVSFHASFDSELTFLKNLFRKVSKSLFSQDFRCFLGTILVAEKNNTVGVVTPTGMPAQAVEIF